MGKIVAVGGGSIGHGDRPLETTEIDQEIVRLSEKRRPRLLFIPTASLDSPDYVAGAEEHFGGRLGCRVEALCLYADRPSKRESARRVREADIIYVGGGNTLRMMRLWKPLGVSEMLRRAYRRGAIMCGVSAGAICWFRHGCSDSRKFSNPEAGLIRVSGLGLVDALVCPHYDAEKDRRPGMRRIMARTPGIGIALDNCAALEFVDGRYRVVTSSEGAKAYRVWREGGRVREEELEGSRRWREWEGLGVHPTARGRGR